MNNQQKNKWIYYVTIVMVMLLVGYVINSSCSFIPKNTQRVINYIYLNQSGDDIELDAYSKRDNFLFQPKQFIITNNTTVSIGGTLYAKSPYSEVIHTSELENTNSNEFENPNSNTANKFLLSPPVPDIEPFRFVSPNSNEYVIIDSVVVRYVNSNRCLYYKDGMGVLDTGNYDSHRYNPKDVTVKYNAYIFSREEFETSVPCKE